MRFGNPTLGVSLRAASAVSNFASKLAGEARKPCPSCPDQLVSNSAEADVDALPPADMHAAQRIIYNEAERTFRQADTDGSGRLSIDEVHQLGLLLNLRFSHNELVNAMAAIDRDGSGLVDFSEFYTWWTERKTNLDNCASLR